jgi:hypothetical protein
MIKRGWMGVRSGVLLAGTVMLNAVWVESKLDVTLAVIGTSTTAAGVVDALESGVADAAGRVVDPGGVFEALAVALAVAVGVGVGVVVAAAVEVVVGVALEVAVAEAVEVGVRVGVRVGVGVAVAVGVGVAVAVGVGRVSQPWMVTAMFNEAMAVQS